VSPVVGHDAKSTVGSARAVESLEYLSDTGESTEGWCGLVERHDHQVVSGEIGSRAERPDLVIARGVGDVEDRGVNLETDGDTGNEHP
jgi:hypothetical protein